VNADLPPPRRDVPPPRPDLEEPPPRWEPPDLALLPKPLTIVGFILALAGMALAVPYAVLSSNYFGSPGDVPPSGRQKAIWIVAFFVGTPSLVIGWVSRGREFRRRSRPGWWLSGITIVAALVGASVWAWPIVLEAATGL
jgi:hypothetical protein